MDIEDMGWYGQRTSKIFGQWTLKNILNTTVPDTNLETSPQFLIEQCSEVLVADSNC